MGSVSIAIWRPVESDHVVVVRNSSPKDVSKSMGKSSPPLAAGCCLGDHVKFDGKLLHVSEPLTILLNKPRSYLCTRDDPNGRPTIYDLLPKNFQHLNYVGRLDYQSEGLLILTNSGDLIETLTHPRHHIEKEYLVQLDRPFNQEHIRNLLDGFHFSEGLARAHLVAVESKKRVLVVLTQGYNRQIRRMFAKLEYKVKRLERFRIGSLVDNKLAPGDYRVIGKREIGLATGNPASME